MHTGFFKLTLSCILLLFQTVSAEEYKYLFNEPCILSLYEAAAVDLLNAGVAVSKDSQGIRISFEIKNPELEYFNLSPDVLNKLSAISKFLAKRNNSAIIEVHLSDFHSDKISNLKTWEISTVVANNMGAFLTKKCINAGTERISSIGYGEFYPVKNTPNNGGKLLNRADIIILCDISGE